MSLRYALYVGIAAPILIAAAQQGQPPEPARPTRTDQPGGLDKPVSMSGAMEDPVFRDTLASQEKKMWEQVKAQNWNEFESSLSDQFMGICPTGFQSKPQVMAEMRKGKLNSYTLADWHAVKLSDTSGIVMYRVDCDAMSPDGKANKGTYYCSTTWTQRGGKWQSDAHQTTMSEDAGRDK